MVKSNKSNVQGLVIMQIDIVQRTLYDIHKRPGKAESAYKLEAIYL